MIVCILNQAADTEDRLAGLYKRPASTYVDPYNEISPAWRCIKRRRTSVCDGYRAPGRHRLEYRVLARTVVSPGNAFNCRLYLFRPRIALKGLIHWIEVGCSVRSRTHKQVTRSPCMSCRRLGGNQRCCGE
jgi:hypothetical protein